MSKEASKEELIGRLQTIDPYEFETFVARVWEAEGWTTSVKPGSNDMGVDVVARKQGGVVDQKLVIQTKRYSEGNKVGRPEVQRYLALREQDPEADAVVVVTTSDFTDGARVWAQNHNVKLVDGEDLTDFVRQHNLYRLLDQYETETESVTAIETNEETSSKPSTAVSLEANPPSLIGGGRKWGQRFARWLASLGLFVRATDGKLARMQTKYSPWLPVLVIARWGSMYLMETWPTVAGWLLVIAWLGSPVLVFWDAKALHNQDAPKRPNRVVWPLISMFPLFGLAAYLWWRA